MTTSDDHSVFRMAFQQAWNAVVITSADQSRGYPVESANRSFCLMTGYTADELKGRSLKMLQGPDTDPEVVQRMRVCLQERQYFEGMTTNYRKDGTPYIVRWNISPVYDDSGALTHFVSVQQDMTDYVRSEQKVRMLAKALDSTTDPILLTDAHAKIVFVNQAFAQTTGYEVQDLLGKTPAMLRSGAHDAAFYQSLRRALANGADFKAQFINRRRDGSLYHAEQNISPLRDEHGLITHYISVSRDVTARVEQDRLLREAATIDKLTGLYNRHAGEKWLSEAYSRSLMQGQPLTLLLCDIDHFKAINDTHGHPMGDAVLKNVASVLRQSVRTSDPVIRWGGEEFLAVLNGCSTEQAVDLAERMRHRVAGQMHDGVGQVTISLGLATLAEGESIERLIARTDNALYESKREGRNRLTVA